MKKWRCTVCGYVHEGEEPPDKCPVCGADKSLFEEIIQEVKENQSVEQADTKAKSQDVREPDIEPLPESKSGQLYHFAVKQMLKHHAHPISVHIPNGVLPLSFIFVLLSALSGCKWLQMAASCNMVFVVLTMPFVLFSGYIEWQKRYNGFISKLFLTKILCATIVAVTSLVIAVWWFVEPDVLTTSSLNTWIFICINLIALTGAAIAGFIGGKLVFKD